MNLQALMKELENPKTASEETLEATDIDKLAELIESRSNGDCWLNKVAEAIKSISEEYREIVKIAQNRDLAERIVMKMADAGLITAETMFKKAATFAKKSEEELRVLDKALELSKVGEFSLGILSEKSLYGLDSVDPAHALEAIIENSLS